MLDINWLKTFVTLAELQHFGKSAIALHMTQPNVSLHLKQLEKVTRTKLIERSPFRLTQAGQRLLKSSQKTLQELKVCQADINALNELHQGTLTIAASDIISRALLIEPFQLFKQEYPNIDLALFNTTSSQASSLVKSADAELGFVIAQKESLPLHFSELKAVHWCAVGHQLSLVQGEVVQKDSKELPTLILLGHDTRTRDLIDLALPTLNLPGFRVMEVGSVDAQIDWAEAGFGTAIVPDFSIYNREHLKAEVVTLLDFPCTSLGYVVRKNQVLSKAVKHLLRLVSKQITI
ncbi:LysR family transcriptional regulator [Psychromonas arctica]|uniref:LysR family transcriptional regulator n=1 Tax=Psychromonas arctica TaxID=168275 RepID=UPI002FD6CDCD